MKGSCEGYAWPRLERLFRLDLGFLALGLLALGLLVLLLAAAPSAAQRPRIETFSIGEGLPSATIYDLAQDASGRLWIAGRGGVTVYDGRVFHTVSSDEGWPKAVFQAVATDREGRVWVVTRSRPRVYLRDGAEVWQRLPDPPSRDPENRAVALGVLTTADGTWLALGTTQEGVYLWDGVVWRGLAVEQGLPSSRVTDLVPFEGGFVVAMDAGLFEIRDGQAQGRLRTLDPRLSGRIVALEVDRSREREPRLWIAGFDWAGSLQGGRLEVLVEGLDLRRFDPSTHGAIAVDPAGGVYIGSPEEAWFWDPLEGRLGRWGTQQGLIAEGVTALLVDREANVWVGGMRGLTKICSRRFLTYDQLDGLLEPEVTAVAELEPGRIVMGHDSGLTFLDAQGVTARSFRPPEGKRLDAHRVLDMVVDASGQGWAAAQSMGLLRLGTNGSWSVVPEISLASAVELDPQGRLWVTGGEYFWRRDAGGFRRFERPPEAAELPSFRWLAFAPDGRLFLATRRGLLVGAGDRWQVVHGPTPEADDVYNLLVEETGDAWVGTAAGLYRLRGDELVPARLGGWHLARPVYQIVEDRRGRLWFGTDDGVWRWEAPEWRHFTVRHGLAGRETNRGAALVDHLGRLWLGTDQGVSVFQEPYDRGPAAPPRPEIRALEVLGELRELTRDVELEPHETTFSFHLDLIALAREAIEWRYLLEGFDPAWQGPEPATEGGLRYTNVPPGTYRLRVATRWALQEQWSEEAVSPALYIRKPYWQRTWFVTLSSFVALVVLVGGPTLLAGAMRARARRFEAINRQLAEQMAEREKVEKALRASEARLGTIFGATPDAVSVSRLTDGTFLEVNEAFLRMTGYDRDEVEGRSSLDMNLWVDPDDRTEVARRLADGPVHNFEVSLGTKEGERVTCLISAGVIEIGNELAVLAVLRDISDRKRADEERERLIRELETRHGEIERFAYTLSHDLKTPLVTLKGFLGLLERDLEAHDSQRIDRDVDHIRRASDTMGALLDDLLIFLSVDSRSVRRQEVALSDVVEETVAPFAERIRIGGVELRIGRDLPRVKADPRLLGQALVQLIDNALTHLGAERPPWIEIDADCVAGRCVVTVRDNGLGIERRYQAKIFDLFERLEPGTDGTGLGLALVRRIAELHGGRAWVESEGRGRGAAFYFDVEAVG